MPTANLSASFSLNNTLNSVVAHKVYTRNSWGDAWVEQRYISCVSASWAISPRTSTAELAFNYGNGKLYDLPTFANVLPDTGARRYVKVEWLNDSFQIGGNKDSPAWYGIVNGVGTRQGGTRGNIETGQQVIQCVGLEKLLEDTIVRTSAWQGSDGNVYYVDRGLAFNDHRADRTAGGNRTAAKVGQTYIFSGKVKDDDAFWTTRDILEYLIDDQPPVDKNGYAHVPFVLDTASLAVLGTWVDKPLLPTDGRSLRDLLNQLLPHQRMLAYRLSVTGDDAVSVSLISLAGDNIALPNGGVLNANPRRWAMDLDGDSGDVSRVLSHAEAVDRVRVRGSRARSVFSITNSKGNLVTGWTSALETEYEAGASGVSGYSALTTAEKNRRNRIARNVDRLSAVYRRFKIPDTWDGGTEYSGGGGITTHFCPYTTSTPYFKFYQRELYLLRTLPMRDGYDYSTLTSTGGGALPPAKVSDGPFAALPPLVLMKVPGQTRYIQIENIGASGDLARAVGETDYSWSGRVRVPPMDRALVIDVVNDQQHIIAGADFSPLTEDSSQADSGAWDWKDMICTVAAEWDAFCEGVYPTPSASVSNNDVCREVMLQAADTFRLDWLVPNTVVGVSSDGQLVRCTAGGWINDDRAKLDDRAKMAFQWFGIERRAIQFSSGKINGTIRPGDYVATLGTSAAYVVNSVISEVRIDCPIALDGEPPAPRISYTTDYVTEFDLYLDGISTTRREIDHFG